MNLKKWYVFLLIIVLLLPAFSVNVFAAESSKAPEFRYELTVDGNDTVEVNTGDVITITLHLYRTDEDANYTMYAMQDEIRYDSEFFELVDDSILLSDGIQSTDIALVDNHREFYMNYVSLTGGNTWNSKMRVGTFQLRDIGVAGTSTITNQDYLVSLPDGSGSYKCDANELTVIVSSECTIKFETNGGTPIEPIIAIYGEKLERPEDPVREGKHLAGWFKDIHLTEEWDFDKDTVKGNMTLYAKWADGSGKGLSINMDWLKKIPIVPIAIVLGVLLLLYIAWRFLVAFLGDRRYVMYSLVNGDIKLNYRNDKRNVHISVVLNSDHTEYVLGKIETSTEEKYIRYIENEGQRAVVHMNPGIYDGKLIIKDESGVLNSMCQIKVTDKELK